MGVQDQSCKGLSRSPTPRKSLYTTPKAPKADLVWKHVVWEMSRLEAKNINKSRTNTSAIRRRDVFEGKTRFKSKGVR